MAITTTSGQAAQASQPADRIRNRSSGVSSAPATSERENQAHLIDTSRVVVPEMRELVGADAIRLVGIEAFEQRSSDGNRISKPCATVRFVIAIGSL